MILSCISIFNGFILLLLSLLHFYWAFGGNWGVRASVPEQFNSIYFNPSNKLKIKIATIIVAFGLLAFAYLISNHYFSFTFSPFSKYQNILTRIIGVLFMLRAFGDFNMFGLFKKKQVNLFAQKDSQIFVPLCLYLGLSTLVLTVL